MNKINEKVLMEYGLEDFGKIKGAMHNNSELFILGENKSIYIKGQEDDGDTTVAIDYLEISKEDIFKRNEDYIYVSCENSNHYIANIDIYTLGCHIITTNGYILFNLKLRDEVYDYSLLPDKYPIEELETNIEIKLLNK